MRTIGHIREADADVRLDAIRNAGIKLAKRGRWNEAIAASDELCPDYPAAQKLLDDGHEIDDSSRLFRVVIRAPFGTAAFLNASLTRRRGRGDSRKQPP